MSRPGRCAAGLPALLLLALLLALAGCTAAVPDDAALRRLPDERVAALAERLQQAVQDDPTDEAALRDLARVELRLARVEPALEHAQRAVQAGPFEGRNHLVLGEAFEADGRYVRALTAYGEAIELAPDLLPAYVRKARMHAQLGETKDALSALAEAQRREPRYFPAWILQARLLLQDNQVDAARAAVEQARALRPEELDARVLHARILRAGGRVDAALRLVADALAGHPDDRALLGLQVRLHRERGEWADARAALGRLERLGPLTPAERLLRVDVLEGEGRTDAAQAELTALLREAPDFQPAHVRMAAWLVRRGAADAALREAQQAIALAPQAAEGHYWEAAAYYQLGQPALGDAALESTARLQPGQLAVTLLQVIQQMAAYRMDKADPTLDALLRDNGERPAVLLVQAERAALKGFHELSGQVLERLPPTFEPAQVRFARLRLAYLTRQWAEVVRQSEGLLGDPLLGWRAAYVRAVALLRQGQRKAALAVVTPYLERRQRRVLFHHLAGYLYLLEGDVAAARRVLLAGIAIAPGNPLLIEPLSRMAMDAQDWARARELLEQGLQAPGRYRTLFLERLIRIGQQQNDASLRQDALLRYLEADDPLRSEAAPLPASDVLYGSYVPDYDLAPAL